MIVAGLGFTTTAEASSLRAAYDKAAAGQVVAALATVADKAGHPALEALAAELALPLHLIPVVGSLLYFLAIGRLRSRDRGQHPDLDDIGGGDPHLGHQAQRRCGKK